MRKELKLSVVLGMLAGAAPAVAIEALTLAPGEKIVLDGRLDEPAWNRAQLLDRFWEVFPQAEVEARVRTEAAMRTLGSWPSTCSDPYSGVRVITLLTLVPSTP